MIRTRLRPLGLALLSLFAAVPATAAPPAPFPDTPRTMGQPRRVTLTWGPLGGYDFDAERQRSRLFIAANATPSVPQVGLANLTMEGVVGTVGSSLDLGIGAYLKIPWVKAGIEYSFADHEYIPDICAEIALKRGGLFRNGDELRLDYRPWDRQVLVGFTFNSPFRSYRMTRPREIHASLPEGERPKPDRALVATEMPAGFDASMKRVETAVKWMDELLTPRFRGGDEFEGDARAYRDHIRRPGHTFAEEDAAYHRELAHAFRIAVGGDGASGEAIAREAESVILKRILIPFNRLFGQNKKPHNVWGLALAARMDFDAYLAAYPALNGPDPERNRLADVVPGGIPAYGGPDQRGGGSVQEALEAIEHLLAAAVPPGLVPLNYGLRPSQYDTPEEWDSLATALTGGVSTDANTIEYLPNEQFHLELKRMIRDTESYHVLHIHDLRGRRKSGEADLFGWDLVIDGYIEALRQAVVGLTREGGSGSPNSCSFSTRTTTRTTAHDRHHLSRAPLPARRAPPPARRPPATARTAHRRLRDASTRLRRSGG